MPGTPHLRPRSIGFVAAAGVVLALALAGCGADTPSQRDLASALVDSGISQKVATCASKAIIGTLDDEELQTLVERGAGGAPVDDPKRTDDSADQLRDALGKCRELITPTTTTTAPNGSTVPDDGPSAGAVTSTTAAGSVPASDDAQFNTTTTP